MRVCSLLVLIPIAAGCADPIVVDGAVDGFDIGEAGTVFFGGPFIVVTDEVLECREMAWVQRTYDVSAAPTDFDFVGVQFTYDEDDVSTGNYSVAGEAAVYAKGLVVSGGVYTEYRSNGGELVLTGLESNILATGSFNVTFDEGSLSTELFEAEWCVNMER